MRFYAALLLCISIGVVCMSMPAQAESKNEGILLVAFGTSQEEALPSYIAINAAFDKAYVGKPVVWAYTSSFIRNKLAKQGKPVFSITQALDALKEKGVKQVTVQSLHVVAGEEYAYLERALQAYALRNPGTFTSLHIGRPLLESSQDLNEAVNAVFSAFPKERSADEAIVFMGHGHEHGRGDLILQALANGLNARDPLTFFATVEGALNFNDVLETLKAKKVKRVWLQPFMIVAGDHARNDLMGDEEDSWASQLKAAGFDVRGHVIGLGELSGIQDIFVRHARETTDDVTRLKDDKQP